MEPVVLMRAALDCRLGSSPRRTSARRGMKRGRRVYPWHSALESTLPTIDLLTVQNVADLFQLRPRKVREHVRDHGLPHVRIGRAFRFRREDVDRWLAAHTQAAKRPGASRPSAVLPKYDWSKSHI